MDKELEDFRREIDKIKDFCVLVATEHNHVPNINRTWHNDDDDSIYGHNSPWSEDLNKFTGVIMKALLEIDYRIERLEANVALVYKEGENAKK
jgi:hypothetical protein